jgi:hypothetical protein
VARGFVLGGVEFFFDLALAAFTGRLTNLRQDFTARQRNGVG